MVLQLTDFTSEITDEELREFTSEYYIPFALHPVVPAASANRKGCTMELVAWSNQRLRVLMYCTHTTCAVVPGATVEAPRTSPLDCDDLSRRDRETGSKGVCGTPVGSAYGGMDMVTAQHSRAWWPHRVGRLSSERGQIVQEEEEICLLERHSWQMAGFEAETEASRVVTWGGGAVKYLEGGKNNQFCLGWIEFRQRVEGGLLERKRSRMESYANLKYGRVSSKSLGDVVKCALARYLLNALETMKLLELPHIAQLERDQDYLIGVIMAGLTLARHATEGAEAQPNYFLKPDVAQPHVPIFACPPQ
ncbi:hypothetical protein Tco_0854911 [Tanacetum coccineum]